MPAHSWSSVLLLFLLWKMKNLGSTFRLVCLAYCTSLSSGLLCQLHVSAQSYTLLPSPHFQAPLVVWVVQDSLMEEVERKISVSKDISSVSLYLFNGDSVGPRSVADSVNYLLNRPHNVDRQRMHLVIAGDHTFFDRYNYFVPDIFASRVYMHAEPIDPDHAGQQAFRHLGFFSTSLDELLRSISREYTWTSEINRIHGEAAEDQAKQIMEKGVGINIGVNTLHPRNTTGYIPNAFMIYGLHGYAQLNKHWRLQGVFNLGLQLPNPQKEAQSQVQSQIDPSVLLNGGSGTDTVELNLTVNGHVYFQLGADLIYQFTPKGKFRPFVGVGLATNTLTAFSAKIDTTLEIDLDSFTGGSGGLGLEEGDGAGAETDPSLYRYFSMPVSAGFRGTLSKRLDFQFTVRYDNNMRTFSPNAEVIQMLSFQTGLTYRFNRGKKRLFYRYVRLRND